LGTFWLFRSIESPDVVDEAQELAKKLNAEIVIR
jgi:hypothetical protein